MVVVCLYWIHMIMQPPRTSRLQHKYQTTSKVEKRWGKDSPCNILVHEEFSI